MNRIDYGKMDLNKLEELTKFFEEKARCLRILHTIRKRSGQNEN